jgi:hypothetical protein
MSREILDSVWSASGIRLIGDGVPAGDVMAAQAKLTHWDEWFPYWIRLGDTYERLAREALARNRRQSTGELFWQACLSYHYAQFLWFHDPVRRDQGQMRKVALYCEAAPLFAAPAIRFDVPFDGFVILGYLRLPPGASGRVPVVIVLGGLESTKEESYRFENLCLARGLATCTFDGALATPTCQPSLRVGEAASERSEEPGDGSVLTASPDPSPGSLTAFAPLSPTRGTEFVAPRATTPPAASSPPPASTP